MTLLTNVIDCDLSTLHVTQRVRATFVATAKGGAIPYFKPVDAA